MFSNRKPRREARKKLDSLESLVETQCEQFRKNPSLKTILAKLAHDDVTLMFSASVNEATVKTVQGLARTELVRLQIDDARRTVAG